MANATYTATSAPSLAISSVAGSPCVDVRDSQSLAGGLGVNVPGTYDLMAYQRLASALYAHPPGHPPLEGVPVSSATPPHPQLLPPQEALLHGGGLELKEGLGGIGGPGWPYAMYYPYDSLSSYPFAHGYGMAFDASRRKNATRETTATLKAWLNEHKKNPYPTKGEKIMLAIITKMTLTQVSTWFANARRRLKKENKMTWEPRNKTDDDEDDDDFKDDVSSDNERRKDCNESLERTREELDLNGSLNEDIDSDAHIHPLSMSTSGLPVSNASSSSTGLSASSPVKPRMWCLADMAASSSSPTVAPSVVGASKYLHRPLHLETSPYGRPLPLSHRIASPQEALLQVYAKSLGLPPHMAASFPPIPGLNGIGSHLLPPHSVAESPFPPVANNGQSQLTISRPLATRPPAVSSPSSPHLLAGGAKLTPASSHSPASTRSDDC